MTKSVHLSNQITNLRKRKGISQQILADESGLNLRTIQRIEKGDTEPRGDSLGRIAKALNISIEDLSDWSLREDSGSLHAINLSGLFFLLFPGFGILLPIVLWIQNRNKVQGVKELGRKIINHQLTLSLILFLGFLITVFNLTKAFNRVSEANDLTPNLISGSITLGMGSFFILLICLNVYNILIIIINSFKVANSNSSYLYPSINFIKP